MSRLRVMLRGALISEIGLNPEKEYIGGRKEGSDIRLQAEKGISREHFKMKFADGQWQVLAVSRFGDIFSLGQKVEQTPLQHGQSFQIPPYEFTFLDVPDADMPSAEEPNAPVSIGENERTVIGAAPQVPYIKMVNSNGDIREMLRLEVGEVWVAGRDPSCQIIIPDQRVSRRQFEIYKVNGAYTVLDLASVNGTFLNGSPVSSTDPQTLKSGDAISVLDNTMYFELHDPNFQYKVDRIEIPPLQMEAPEEEFVDEQLSEEPAEYVDGEVEEYEQQYGVPQQIEAQGNGPFTGMPGPDPMAGNQYYDFQPPPAAEEPPPPTGLKKLLQNKPLLIILVLLILGGAYYASELMKPPPAPVTQTATVDTTDPFNKLPPDKQKQIEELYSLAEQMESQGKYELAVERAKKILEILPTGYKDTERIKARADQSLMTYLEVQKAEELAKAQAERDAKNKKIIDECAKKLSPTITRDEMSQCLAEPSSFDPENAEITRLLDAASKVESDKAQKEREAKTTAELVEELRVKFQDAEAVQADGYAFKAIRKYQAVVAATSLPDPGKLRDKARERITYIENKIREKSEGSISLADQLFREGKIKQSVLTLRDAVIYDPLNKSIKEKIELYSLELKRQVRSIYQESIIDENYGLIDNTETKVGAKDKWKKITEIDLEDGEYYRKAVIKLRRYGAM